MSTRRGERREGEKEWIGAEVLGEKNEERRKDLERACDWESEDKGFWGKESQETRPATVCEEQSPREVL